MPWNLNIDFQNEILEAKQRNWFLIGYRTNTVSLRFIRNVTIQEHIFGANIHIRTMGENFMIKYLDKKDAEKIKNLLLEFNRNRGNQIIIG